MRFALVILAALFCLNATAEISIGDSMIAANDDVLVQEAERLVSEEAARASADVSTEAVKVEAKSEAKPEAATAALKESEIPVLVETKKEAKSEDNLIWRLIASVGFIIALGGGLIYASKRMAHKKTTGGGKVRIETLHQIHFGPRKSLALVRVAGEVILLGMTDTNISMIKQVMLIDDELEDVMGKDFNKFIQDDFAIEDVRNALSRV